MDGIESVDPVSVLPSTFNPGPALARDFLALRRRPASLSMKEVEIKESISS
jgi:hypothetical protein